MLKTFRYRIYPTKAQATKLRATLELCRALYNAALQERREAYRLGGKSLGYQEQQNELPSLKDACPEYRTVHSLVLQDVLHRLDKAFTSFFRRLKAGAKPGYPRFRGYGRYHSLTYPQYANGAKLLGSYLHLSKVGVVELVLHRPLEGTPKTVTVCLSPTGKWYACVACEWEPTALAEVEAVIGIDVGLASFATFSNAEHIANPRFLRKEQKALARVQRKHAKLGRGSQMRRKHRKVVARVHERVKFRRSDFAHQQSRLLVNTYQVIAVEDLAVKWMVNNHSMAKSIQDAAWSSFSELLRVKAEWAARRFIAVNPAYTSQDCSRCGHRQKMRLSERVYKCPCCGLVVDRDHNAALNILALGLQRIGTQSVEAPSFSRGE